MGADPQRVMPSICKQLKDVRSQEKIGWSSPQASRQKSSGLKSSLPKIASRPSTNAATSPLPGGRFVAGGEAKIMEVDVSEFKTCLEQFAVVNKECESSASYHASFLASLDIFSTWSWIEILELSKSFRGIQIDRGVSLFAQGDRIEGLHVLHRGEAQLEFSDLPAERPSRIAGGRESAPTSHGADQVAYGYAVDITADSDGLPMTRISKKRLSKSFALTVVVDIFFALTHPRCR